MTFTKDDKAKQHFIQMQMSFFLMQIKVFSVNAKNFIMSIATVILKVSQRPFKMSIGVLLNVLKLSEM